MLSIAASECVSASDARIICIVYREIGLSADFPEYRYPSAHSFADAYYTCIGVAAICALSTQVSE